ncbi:hypothetical protein [Mesorhizobium sp. 2RAF21]
MAEEAEILEQLVRSRGALGKRVPVVLERLKTFDRVDHSKIEV